MQTPDIGCQAAVWALPPHLPADIGELQQLDEVIQEVLIFWQQGRYPTRDECKNLFQSTLVLLKQWNLLVKHGEVIYCQVSRIDGGEGVFQVLQLAALKEQVLTEINLNHGHQGVDRTLELLRQRCCWPGMLADVQSWCQTCERCQVAKDTRPPKSYETLVCFGTE